MKCPYCKIHYMDDERECPICGRPNPSRRPVKAAVPVQKNRKAPKAKPDARATARPAGSQKQPSNLRVGLIIFVIVFLFCLLPSLIGLFFSYLPL